MNIATNAWLRKAVAEMPSFRPGIWYDPVSDCLIYLKEDCSYRAQVVDSSLTVLLHPNENRSVGIKLKSIKFVLQALNATERNVKSFSLKSAIEIAEKQSHKKFLERGLSDEDGNRWSAYYKEAERFVQGVEIHDKSFVTTLNSHAKKSTQPRSSSKFFPTEQEEGMAMALAFVEQSQD